MICPDCRASLQQLCAVHAATDNLTAPDDPQLLLQDARRWLETGGRHRFGCAAMKGRTMTMSDCTCGLFDLIIRLRDTA